VSAYPSVSVIIPCYNKGSVLRETLDSALAQTYAPCEVIVVDDGSTDDSAAVAASYAPHVTLVRQENRGESVARNRAIDMASGDWIALLDADDVWERDKLARQVEVIRARGDDLMCVYTDAYKFDGTQRTGEVRKPEYHAAPDCLVQLLLDWSIIPSSAVVRTDAARRVRFPEEIRHSEDMIFFVELRALGSFARIPECLTGYRRTEGNQSAGPRHKLESIRSRWTWFTRNVHRYTEEERRAIRASFAEQLRYPHDVALYGQRDPALARECRELHRVILPELRSRPATFERRLYPPWAYRLRDLLRGRARQPG